MQIARSLFVIPDEGEKYMHIGLGKNLDAHLLFEIIGRVEIFGDNTVLYIHHYSGGDVQGEITITGIGSHVVHLWEDPY